MLPRLTSYYVSDVDISNAVLRCKFLLRNTGIMLGSYLKNGFGCKFGVLISLALGYFWVKMEIVYNAIPASWMKPSPAGISPGSPVLLAAISGVISVGAFPEMLRVNAGRIITRVTYSMPAWVFSCCHEIRDSCRPIGPRPKAELPIALAGSISGPIPALASLATRNESPKSLSVIIGKLWNLFNGICHGSSIDEGTGTHQGVIL